MKKITLILLFSFCYSSLAFCNLQTDLKCLQSIYPIFQIVEHGNFIQFTDGTRMPVPDKTGLDIQKDFDFIVENVTSLEQSFKIPYILGFATDASGHEIVSVPYLNDDPGRIRYEAFFKKVYGASKEEVEANLVSIAWAVDNTTIVFNKRFGAAAALEQVSLELGKLVREKPEYKMYLASPLGGTFQWRTIAGSKNLSVHSFGVAIDINTKYTDYWLWDHPEGGNPPAFRNRIPADIADIFEAHGFIWGGKWSHYDTMHFEYRPELICAAQYF